MQYFLSRISFAQHDFSVFNSSRNILLWDEDNLFNFMKNTQKYKTSFFIWFYLFKSLSYRVEWSCNSIVNIHWLMPFLISEKHDCYELNALSSNQTSMRLLLRQQVIKVIVFVLSNNLCFVWSRGNGHAHLYCPSMYHQRHLLKLSQH